MEENRPAAFVLFGGRISPIILVGGAVLALVATGLCLAFGNLMAVMMNGGGLEFAMTVTALLLVTIPLRWMAEKGFGRAAEPEREYTAVTATRIYFQLATIGALPMLAVGWIALALTAPAHQQFMLDALLLAFVGSIIFVTFPLHLIDNGLLLLRAVARSVAKP